MICNEKSDFFFVYIVFLSEEIDENTYKIGHTAKKQNYKITCFFNSEKWLLSEINIISAKILVLAFSTEN